MLNCTKLLVILATDFNLMHESYQNFKKSLIFMNSHIDIPLWVCTFCVCLAQKKFIQKFFYTKIYKRVFIQKFFRDKNIQMINVGSD